MSGKLLAVLLLVLSLEGLLSTAAPAQSRLPAGHSPAPKPAPPKAGEGGSRFGDGAVKINVTEPLDFGQVRVGSKASRDIVLTCERHRKACSITDLQVRASRGHQARDFLLISGAPSNSTTLVVSPGATRKITLVFAPTRKGASQVIVTLRENGQWREFKVTAEAI